MVIEIREVSQQDKAQWLQLWEGYTRFYGSPQPSDVTLDLRFVSFTKAPG